MDHTIQTWTIQTLSLEDVSTYFVHLHERGYKASTLWSSSYMLAKDTVASKEQIVSILRDAPSDASYMQIKVVSIIAINRLLRLNELVSSDWNNITSRLYLLMMGLNLFLIFKCL